jgi:hypothetical protein
MKMTLSDMFRNPSKEMLDAQVKADEERQRSAKEVYALAEKCYGSEEFTRYRKMQEYTERLYIEAMLEYSNPDPIQYAFVMQKYAGRVLEMRNLKSVIEKDLRKAKQ